MRLVTIAIVALSARAEAYAVGPAIPLDQLAKQADLICKVTAVRDKPGSDRWYEPVTGFDVIATELRVGSCWKGKPPRSIVFVHYEYAKQPVGIGYAPQFYSFTAGKTYVLFASAGARAGAYRQLWKSHTMKPDQGLMPVGDDQPLAGATIGDVIHAELSRMLAGSPADAIAAIAQLDALSGGGLSQLHDLERAGVLAELRPLVLARDVDVATAAIGVFGADSPYYVEDDAPYWLAGVGNAEISGLSPRKPPAKPSADAALQELVSVATGNPALRARAIRALGRSHAVPAATVATWARDPDPAVRRAAVTIAAELPDHSVITAAAKDADAGVRRAAALAAGFAQDGKLLPTLDTLLGDADGKVAEAAAMGVLAFGGDHGGAVMKKHLTGDYRSLFVNALARKDPAPYLAQLADVIEHDVRPKQWWGGSTPAGDSWRLVFEYVKTHPGNHDKLFDALEHMKWFSSSEPRDLYALYVKRGLAARAKQFRAALKTAVSYSMDSYLDEADQHPERFVP